MDKCKKLRLILMVWLKLNTKSTFMMSFFEWLEEPRQIIFFSSLFIFITILITKLSKQKRRSNNDFSIRDPSKGHHWINSDFIIKPYYCNICETSLVQGVFCDSCWICVHYECENKGNELFACKVMTLSERQNMRHHWVKGNLPLCSKCSVCSTPCGTEPRLCDFRCVWCQMTIHEGLCFAKMKVMCDFGLQRYKILPPYCVTLKQVIGWRGKRLTVIKSVRKPNFDQWKPILVIANPKSGGNEGGKLLHVFRGLLNPAQVIDISEIAPENALEFCRLLPDIQCKVLVCGGDGTVGWVLDAINKVDLPIQPLVAIHPLGTGNDLARILGWGMKYVGDEYEVGDVLKDLDRAVPVLFDRWKVTIEHQGFFNKCNRKVLYMNSYVSIGCDAQVVLNFHKHRENQPSLFTSRVINKLMYFFYGSQDVLQAQCKNLHQRVDLVLDGQVIQLPQLEGIVILNINSWCGGCEVWNDTSNVVSPSRFNDGYLEVFGLYSSLHIAKLQVNLAKPLILGQAKSVKILIKKTRYAKNVPMQLDGEPWEQGACTVTVEHHNHASMLKKSDEF